MPFGAAVLDGGRARFALWAPARDAVALVLPGRGEQRLAMEPGGEGWFGLEAEAAVGEPYLFDVGDGRGGALLVADPASRGQAGDAAGPSLVVDPAAYRWRHTEWRGRPWAGSAVHEIHVGTFTPEGTFRAASARLHDLAELGVTAVELMPVADFPGRRGWGYDGVLPFAPDRAYGTPEDLKALVDEAHGLGLAVLLDVVYNHFGPEGNYLPSYAPGFFTEDFHTPWGAAIDFRQRPVRDFYVHNALYWLGEYRFDGLRLDAVHAIEDPSDPHILAEIARAARELGTREGREVHLVLENERNQTRFLRGGTGGDGTSSYDAQWNDDLHHALHVLLTGEAGGYYEDYADAPAARLARGLAEGFVYQGEPSRHAGGKARGEPSAGLDPSAFVDFLQNHDQVGNRALGERIAGLAEPRAVQACQSVLLLSPHVPMLFMGEEWGATTPFLYFCDFGGELGEAVRQGRRREFAAFFADPAAEVPDPLAEVTFTRSTLDWGERLRPPHDAWLARTRALLRLRAEVLAPRLAAGGTRAEGAEISGPHGLRAAWRLGDGTLLSLVACLGDSGLAEVPVPPGRLLHASSADVETGLPGRGELAPWSAAWFLAEPA